MFSGAGLYCDGVMFGLTVRDTIYLKADEASIADFKRERSGPFTYTRGKKSGRLTQHALPYLRVPGVDDPDELAVWAARALGIAQRQKFAPRSEAEAKAQRLTKNF